VHPKAVTVTADDKSKTFGSGDPSFTFDVAGLESGDSLAGVSCDVNGGHANAGTYPIVCSGNTNENYAASYVAGTLTVNPKPVTVTADDKSKTYGSGDPSFGFQVEGLEPGDNLAGVSCDVTGAHANAGTYPITCSGNTNGNYAASYVAGTLTVNPKPVTVTADDKSKTYGAADPDFSFQVAGLESGDSLADVSCDVTGAHANAGSYDIVCSGNTNGNYTAAYAKGTLTVHPKPVTVKADDQSKTYGSGDPSFGFQVEGLEPGDHLAGVSCDVTGAHVNAGTYPIACSGNTNPNYAATYVEGTLTVNPKPVTVTADDKSKTYGSGDPSFTFDVAGLESGDTLAGVSCDISGDHANAGTYPISCSGNTNGNYAATYVAGTLTVSPKPVTGSFTADDKVYDGTADAAILTRSLEGKVGNDDVSLTGGTASFDNKDVGMHKPVSGGGFALGGAAKDNYLLSSVSGTSASITARPIAVTAHQKSKTYGNGDPVLTYSVTGGSLATGDSFSGSLARDAGESVAGSPYPISKGTLTAGTNYDLAFVGASLTINARPIAVAADAKTKTYGDVDPELTYHLTAGSLVTGDGFSGALARDDGESVAGSPYAIKKGTLSAGSNYELSFAGAGLTITARAITVTAADRTKVLGAADPTLTYSITSGSLVAGDSLSGNLTRDPGEAIGLYAIKRGSLAAGSNYNLAFVSATLRILYATGTCIGSAGHAILQPINTDGTSVFKQGSTVPAKFRVCDASGASIGAAGVVSSFKLVKTVAGTAITLVNESVDSTTPDAAFRWSSSDQQWIYNISTKSLQANKTYFYDVVLNDGTAISFHFGLK
jgi:hypothetical protein